MAALASSPSRPSLASVSSRMIRSPDQVVGGHEQVLLGPEQAEQVGLGDPGPAGDGLGGGAGVAGPGELGDGRGQHGGATLVCGLSARNHHAPIVIGHSLTCQGAAFIASAHRGHRVASDPWLPTATPAGRRRARWPTPCWSPTGVRWPSTSRTGVRWPATSAGGSGRIDASHGGRHRGHLGGLRPGRGRPGRGRGGADARRRASTSSWSSRSPRSTTWPTTWCRTPCCGSATTTCSTPPAGPGPTSGGSRPGRPTAGSTSCSPSGWPRWRRRAAGSSSRTTTWPSWGRTWPGSGPTCGPPTSPTRPFADPSVLRMLPDRGGRRAAGRHGRIRGLRIPHRAVGRRLPGQPGAAPGPRPHPGGPRVARPSSRPSPPTPTGCAPPPPSPRWPGPWPASRSGSGGRTGRSSCGWTGWSCRRTCCAGSGPSTSCWNSKPHRRERVVFVALAYPTRQGLPEYLAYQNEVESTVARINQRWGTPGMDPHRPRGGGRLPRARWPPCPATTSCWSTRCGTA